MKSYFLIGTGGREVTERALDDLLPLQRGPWLIVDATGDPIAYLHVGSNGDVQADISGRHYNEDETVIALLETLRTFVGGEIEDDE